MKKNKIIGLVLTLGLSFLVISGCTNNDVAKLSEEEQLKIVEEVNTLVSTEINSKKVKEKIDSNLKVLDIDNISDLINTYIYCLYSEQSSIEGNMENVYDDLLKISKDLDINNIDDINKIGNDFVKGYLLEARKSLVKFKIEEDNIYTFLDISEIIKEYKDYMNEGLLNFCKFREYETNTKLTKDGKIDFKEIAKRITYIEKALKETNVGDYKTHWDSQHRYYYSYLMLEVGSLPIDADSKKFEEDYINVLKEIKEENKETELSKTLEEYLAILSKNNNTLNSEVTSFLENFEYNKFLKPYENIESMEEGMKTEENLEQKENGSDH